MEEYIIKQNISNKHIQLEHLQLSRCSFNLFKRRNVEFLQRRKNINRKILTIIAILFSIGINAYFSVSLHFILNKNFDSLFNINIFNIINTLINEKRVFIIFCAIELIIVTLLLLFSNRKKNIYHSSTVKLTNKIEVPVPIR